MTPRTLTFVILAAALAAGSPLSAKEKTKPAKKAARTWQTVVDYVFKNGGEDSITAPASRTLGYEADEVFAKSLGLDEDKSKDGREHTVFVIYEKDGNGVPKYKDIVLGSIKITGSGPKTEVDSYRIRISLKGKLNQGMHATGMVGEVVQQPLSADSKELTMVFKSESNLILKELDLAQLTQ